jgi:putative ABC transport system substrate-binding protein
MISRRRRATVFAASAIVAAPFETLAQTPAQPARIGLLKYLPLDNETEIGPFRQGMRELGHVEGKTYVLEVRYADNRPERLPALAEELVKLKPAVIWVTTTLGIDAVKKATSTIPIVFGGAIDPVHSGYVQNLARPGGNMTGMSLQAVDLGGKQLELLRSLSPRPTRVAVLVSPGTVHAAYFGAMQAAANVLGVQLSRYEAGSLGEIQKALARMRGDRAEALIVSTGALFRSDGKNIAAIALRGKISTLFPYVDAVQGGALMCYGPNIEDVFRRSARYVDRILKGAKPADLPVEQPTKFHMAVNKKTAAALGVTLPTPLLLQATEVFE